MKLYNILVTGANGQLGSEISEISGNYPEFAFFFTTRKELDICDKEAVEEFSAKNNITSIINCAAYTAVDKAESEPELADGINHLAVRSLAEIALKYSVKLIHISTDYVFDGNNKKPYKETDIPNPQTVYGKTKLAGEKAIQTVNPKNTIIIRTSWVYSRFGKNFVKTMLRLGRERDEINVVSDQVGSPTNAADLAKAILCLLPKFQNNDVEVYHYSNEGICSWFDFAKTILKVTELKTNVKPISTFQFPTPARRPNYSGLCKLKIIGAFQIKISPWESSLNNSLKHIRIKK